MSATFAAKLMQVMITVSDMERSVAFYTGAFGFRIAYSRTAPDGHEPALELDTKEFRETYLILDGFLLTVCSFKSPSVAAISAGPFNNAGIRRICFGVTDLEEAARRVVESGGKVLEQTRYVHEKATLVVVTDPDGIELEIIQRTD